MGRCARSLGFTAAVVFFLAGMVAIGEEVLTNDAVIKMVAAGLSEDLILVKVESSQGEYKLDTDSLIELKTKRVGDKIIQAMVRKMASPSKGAAGFSPGNLSKEADGPDYEFLSTNRTSTMEKEMNQAAQGGYYFAGLTFGETTFGGKEVIIAMRRGEGRRLEYKLLATNKTSTMEKELNETARQGYRFKESSYGHTAGGAEVITILERSAGETSQKYSYKLLATNKTSTLKKELNKMALEGYVLADLTYGETALGGTEVIAIMELERGR